MATNPLLTPEARQKAREAKRRDFSEKFAEKPTRKTAIDLMCCQCVGGAEESGWKGMIRDCTAGPTSTVPCPLYPFRPYK